MLTAIQRNILEKAGFTDYEVTAWNGTKTDFNHPKFQAMITKRARHCTRLLKAGWTQPEILNSFNKFFRIRRGEGEKNAFADFLESEYNKISGSNKLSDKDMDNQFKLNRALTKVFGKAYNKRLIERKKAEREAKTKAIQASYLPTN